MKKSLQVRTPLSWTKKRSFDLFWNCSGLLAVAIALVSFLVVSEFYRSSNRGAKFLNLRASTLDVFNTKNSVATASIDKSSLAFVFSKDKVLVGSLASVIAPEPKGSLLLLPREGWLEKFEKEKHTLKDSRLNHFGSHVAVAFEQPGDFSETTEVLNEVSRAYELLASHSAVPKTAKFVFIDFPVTKGGE